MNRSEEVRDFYERMPYPAPLTSLDEHRDLYKNPDRRRAKFHLMWPAEQPRGKPRNPDRRLRHIAGGEVRAPRARCSNHGDRHQRHEPAPHARSSAQVQSGESRTASAPDRERPGDRALFRPGGLYGSAASPARPGLGSSRPSRRPETERRDAPDGLRTLRPGRNLYDAGVLPPARNRRVGDGSARSRRHARSAAARTTRSQACCAGRRISGGRKQWRTRSFIPRIAPTPSRSCMRGSIGAACPSAAGSSRLPTSPNAGWWRVARTLRVWPHCPLDCSTPPSSSSAEQWFRTASSRTAMIARDESQPINFAGDSWRDYVPIALPWTVCVRERLPPGSVAVLINRSHTFTDLILTVDSFEDRLLGAIDGNRTLAEILQIAAQDERWRAPSPEILRAPLAIRSSRL